MLRSSNHGKNLRCEKMDVMGEYYYEIHSIPPKNNDQIVDASYKVSCRIDQYSKKSNTWNKITLTPFIIVYIKDIT